MHAFEFITLIFFAVIAISEQKPVNDADQKSNNKDKSNGTSETMMPKENIDHTMDNLPSKNLNWAYVSQMPSSLYRNGEIMDSARTNHLRPSMYSQYQTVPQAYVMPNYHVPAFEYSSPYAHYPNHGYGYYKNAEELNSRQFMPIIPSEKYISSMNPGVQYLSKYVVDKSLVPAYSGMQEYYQPQTSQSMMQPMLLHSMHAGETHQYRDAAEDTPVNFYQPLPMFQRSGVTIDDKLQWRIPRQYMSDRLPSLTDGDIYQSLQLGRAVEESQPWEWNRPMAVMSKAGGNQQLSDGYIAPSDQVIMVPVTDSRTAQMEIASYPNLEQQIRMAKMQSYYNDMNAAASRTENLAKDFSIQKSFMEKGPGVRSATETTKQPTKEEILSQIATLLETYKSQLPPSSEKSAKQEKTEQDTPAKINEASATGPKKNQ